MKNFIDYIENSCRGLGESQSAYRYKKMLLDQMNQRAVAVAKAGLKDENKPKITKALSDIFVTLL